MRQLRSYGSVKAIFLDREAVLKNLEEVVQEAFARFPELREVRLFGSFFRGDITGLSDLDLLLIVEDPEPNPIKRTWKYYEFFTSRLPIACDLLTIRPGEEPLMKEYLENSRSLGSSRGAPFLRGSFPGGGAGDP